MMRVILTQLVLFLLPFLAYALWIWLSKRSRHPENWTRGPVAWLTLAGLLLVIVSFVFLDTFNQAPEGTQYRPSEMRDGVFVPGRFE